MGCGGEGGFGEFGQVSPGLKAPVLGFITFLSTSPGPSSPRVASDRVVPLPRSALLVQLATSRPRPVKARPLDWRVQSKDWPHAGQPVHELRYSIYRDLWERGFFLSAAGKFGGDFLVYPGELGLGAAVAVLSFTLLMCSGTQPFFPLPSKVCRIGPRDLRVVTKCIPQLPSQSYLFSFILSQCLPELPRSASDLWPSCLSFLSTCHYRLHPPPYPTPLCFIPLSPLSF